MSSSDSMVSDAHDSSNEKSSRSFGLALSGGGVRASFFHIGVLARLAELDLLGSVEALSTVSGGSIVGALYCLHVKKRLKYREGTTLGRDDYVKIVQEIETSFLAWVQTDIRSQIFANIKNNMKLFRNFLPMPFRPNDSGTGGLVGRLYDALYMTAFESSQPVLLSDLSLVQGTGGAPELFINATETNAGLLWWFTPTKVGAFGDGDEFPDEPRGVQLLRRSWDVDDFPDLTLGRAVAASACVPGVFSSVTLKLPRREAHEAILPIARLVDGGVLDNLGLQALVYRGCRKILASDGSAHMPFEIALSESQLRAASRSLSVAMESISQSSLRQASRQVGVKVVSLGESTSKALSKPITQYLSTIRTDLDAFSDIEADALMAAGYLKTRAVLEHDESWVEAVLQPEGSQAPKYSDWRFGWIFDELTRESDSRVKRVLEVAAFRWKTLRLVPYLAQLAAGSVVIAALVWWVMFIFEKSGMDLGARVSLLIFGPILSLLIIVITLAVSVALFSLIPRWLFGRLLLRRGCRPSPTLSKD